MNPFEDFGAHVVRGELVAECERIANAPLVEHERVATDVADATLAVAGMPDEPVLVSVHRVAGRLRVSIAVGPSVPDRVRRLLAVRVAGRLRGLDPDAAGIDIGTVDRSR
jgi:hypothetical protein